MQDRSRCLVWTFAPPSYYAIRHGRPHDDDSYCNY
jgi:hypothetical protein